MLCHHAALPPVGHRATVDQTVAFVWGIYLAGVCARTTATHGPNILKTRCYPLPGVAVAEAHD